MQNQSAQLRVLIDAIENGRVISMSFFQVQALLKSIGFNEVDLLRNIQTLKHSVGGGLQMTANPQFILEIKNKLVPVDVASVSEVVKCPPIISSMLKMRRDGLAPELVLFDNKGEVNFKPSKTPVTKKPALLVIQNASLFMNPQIMDLFITKKLPELCDVVLFETATDFKPEHNDLINSYDACFHLVNENAEGLFLSAQIARLGVLANHEFLSLSEKVEEFRRPITDVEKRRVTLFTESPIKVLAEKARDILSMESTLSHEDFVGTWLLK